jgi:polysaccharide pyruvyl transferase WcaK-like protein
MMVEWIIEKHKMRVGEFRINHTKPTSGFYYDVKKWMLSNRVDLHRFHQPISSLRNEILQELLDDFFKHNPSIIPPKGRVNLYDRNL